MSYNPKKILADLALGILKHEALPKNSFQDSMCNYLVYNAREDYKLILDVTYLDYFKCLRREFMYAISYSAKSLETIEVGRELGIDSALTNYMYWEEYGSTWAVRATSYVPKSTTHHWEVK